MKTKRGQLTIFIILAIAIIFVLIVLFLNRSDFKSLFNLQSPSEQIIECTQNSLKQAIDIISFQGGSLNPENFFLYKDNKIEYLCYTQEDYRPCKMQKPILKSAIESEIKKYSEPKIKECIESVKRTLEDKGDIVSLKEPVVSIELLPNNVLAEIDLDLQINSQDSTESYKIIKADIGSKLYEFSAIASKIVNDEVTLGDSETLAYMLTNKHWLKVEKKKQSEGTKIYILTNRESGDEFWFATRSYAMPAGALK